MKFLLLLSFLLFAAASSINASSFFAEGHTAPDVPPPTPILDVTDAPLKFGVPYYMSPALWAWGGGVSLPPPTPFDLCPKLIGTTPEIDRGTPVIFSSAVPHVTGNITIESELIISFYNLTRLKLCGKSTTWVMTETGDLVVGEEEMGTVFKLTLGGVLDSYFLKPMSPFKNLQFVVGIDESRNSGILDLPFVFRKAKSTEEDEDDKRVIIQMLRKMSV